MWAVVEVPVLFEIAKLILEKYPDGLPKLSDTTINKRLKDITKSAGICTEKKTISRQSGTDSNVTTEDVYRYELITSHTGRRTFISILSLRGYTTDFIKDYSGHKDTRTVERYIKTNAKERALYERMRKEHPELMLVALYDPNLGTMQDVKAATPKSKIEIMDALFAEKTLSNLIELKKANLITPSDWNTPEVKRAVNVIKDISIIATIKANENYSKVNLQKAKARTDALADIIWLLARNFGDSSIYQRYQYKAIQLGWTDKFTEVMDINIIDEIMSNEVAYLESEEYRLQLQIEEYERDK